MKEYFYTITESMLDLGLRGTELNLFAIIFGYSQKGDGCCYATRRELARRCGVSSTRTIDSAIDSLMEKGLVRKSIFHKDDREMVAYSYCAENAHGAQKLPTPCAKNEVGGCAKIAHKEKDSSKTQLENIPTIREVAQYARQRGFVDPDGFAFYFVQHYTDTQWHLSNGKPMKDWMKAVRNTWEPTSKLRRYPAPRKETQSEMTLEQLENYLRK